MRKHYFVLFSLILVLLVSGCVQQTSQSITVGAILPLSGPSALWGNSVQSGMELALENISNVNILYEDSKGTAADGLTAYNSLLERNVDIFVPSLSVVSFPLSSRSLETKVPMIIAQSAANYLTNNYTFRYYTDAEHFAMPSFTSDISPLKNLTRLAVLYRNDEYAKSVAAKIQQLSAAQGKQIVFFESYVPNEVDFSTPLLKIKESTAQALLYIPTPPSESLNILRKAEELNLNMTIMEVSNVMSDPSTQAQAPNITFYTNQFAFSIPGNSEVFKQRYAERFGRTPNFAAAFGYDIINLISTCEKNNILGCLESKQSVTGVTGTVASIKDNDLIVPMYLMRVN